jgi:Flp pilus assembly pilin Flp
MTHPHRNPAKRRFWRDARGATSIEYAIIAPGIAGVLIAVILTTGDTLNTLWTTVRNALG